MRKLIFILLILLVTSSLFAGQGYQPYGSLVTFSVGGTTFQCSPGSWDPADGTDGDADATQELTCTATGEVTIGTISLGGSNSFTDDGTGTCANSGTYTDEACTIDLRFAYDNATCSSCSDTLTITSDAGDQPETVALGTTNVASGVTTLYFGSSLGVSGTSLIDTPTGGAATSPSRESNWNYDATIPWTCPGTGTKHVTDLRAYVKSLGGTPGNIRMAVYTASSSDPGTLMAQGNAKVLVSSTNLGWVSMTGITESNALTGGNNYLIVITQDSADTQIYAASLTDGAIGAALDYTDGFPASFAGSDGYPYNWCLVAGVE